MCIQAPYRSFYLHLYLIYCKEKGDVFMMLLLTLLNMNPLTKIIWCDITDAEEKKTYKIETVLEVI